MFSCGACSLSDPAADTVKIDFAAVKNSQEEPSVHKPEEHPVDALFGNEAARAEQEEAARRLAEEEAARQLAEQKARQEQQEEQERLEQEAAAQRQRDDEEARARKETEEIAAAEAAAKQAEAEQAQAAEAERVRLEKDAEEAEQQELVREAEAKKKMQEFLKKHSFKGPDVKRSKLLGFKFPLHSAVKHNDVEVVRILLANGANTSSKDSSGKTPYQLAQKIDKNGSHVRLMEALAVVN
eukprot:TRINITY_DN240_c0_g2_i2.p1 TRINITY_DN240_c0_g2~~TRINITY_DN240_c0_g2_i2.p1  ORF type:complete len:240 (-),score=94.42 TRINITY_DN240_c0_g2_i2:349-1068(-)